ncbi:MAG TPA: class I SAM-dependent methyltransferase [Phyllobacterium sp.]|nr:class I SAM-dependent methyltransferase [Phyllobacterium sp.]
MKNARAPLKERGNDLYETHPVAVHALLKVEQLPEFIWEPACGPGSIVRTLRAEGFKVMSTDLVDYASPDQDFARRDFLMEHQLPAGTDAIVTNPPFKLANQFAAKALELCPRVYLLLRLAFLESDGRSALLESGHLHRVYVFRNRLPMMHRDGWEGKKSTSNMAFAWFCWNRNFKQATTVSRISWEWQMERAA